MSRTYIYLIESEIGRVKIGVSHSPRARLASIEPISPVLCRLIACWPGVKDDETALHKRFEAQRSHREWFRIEGDLAAFVEAHRGRGVETVPAWDSLGFTSARERRSAAARLGNERRKARLLADPMGQRDEWVRRQVRLRWRMLLRQGASQSEWGRARTRLLAECRAAYDAQQLAMAA